MNERFYVTNAEYIELEKKFGMLTEYAAWQLYRRNTRNNHTDEQMDIAQELKMALVRAGSYYKRQTYIEDCLLICSKYAKRKNKELLEHLQYLWDNKKRHGASKQKFGQPEEIALYALVDKVVPKKERPDKNRKLLMDAKFDIYCKSIMWNAQKTMGKKITKERVIRSSLVSLSEYDYMGS